MDQLTDQELLRHYADAASEAAFAELVRRHVDLVYSAALRMLRDAHLAEDVTQSVFIALAQSGRSLAGRRVLGGWLHCTARNLAAKAIRGNVRRRAREQEAALMNELPVDEAKSVWKHIAPHLDTALGALNEADRDALVLRYFEGKSAGEMAGILGISDEAAQKRVSRAAERLRQFLTKRGITAGASGLAIAISANAVQAAPAALAAVLTSTSLATAAPTGGALSLLKLMTATKLKIGVLGAVIVAGIVLVCLEQWQGSDRLGKANSKPTPASKVGPGLSSPGSQGATHTRSSLNQQVSSPAASPEETVVHRVIQYGRSRRQLVQALAQRHGVEVPDDVKRFFDAVETGNWNKIDARFKVLCGTQPNASANAPGRPTGLEHLWPAIIDAYGAAEQSHLWPAQELLDYGKEVLGSLRPGMVYVGGTDDGRWIPEMLNDTSDGEHHIVITQNGLADSGYREYLSVLYGDRLNMLTEEESKRAFQDYVADAQKRLEHDQKYPDEPKQIRPGEKIQTADGRVQVSGMVAVMAVNERLLQMLLQKNPDLSFGLQESGPLPGTYADAVPLGSLMELRAPGGQNAFTADVAGQTVDYWRTATQQLLSDPAVSNSSPAWSACSHNANAAANLLAAHDFNAEAEQAYRLSIQLVPSNPDAVLGLSQVLRRTGRADEANALLDDFVRKFPNQKSAVDTFRGSIVADAPAASPSN